EVPSGRWPLPLPRPDEVGDAAVEDVERDLRAVDDDAVHDDAPAEELERLDADLDAVGGEELRPPARREADSLEDDGGGEELQREAADGDVRVERLGELLDGVVADA